MALGYKGRKVRGAVPRRRGRGLQDADRHRDGAAGKGESASKRLPKVDAEMLVGRCP